MSSLQAKLATVADSFARPNRILRQNTCRLKGNICASRPKKLLDYGDGCEDADGSEKDGSDDGDSARILVV